MNYPDYVPASVRLHISALLDGDSWEPMGWRESLASAENELAALEATQGGAHREIAEARLHRDHLKAEVACLERLATDERMRDAYALLSNEFSNDEQWRGFVYAAWSARMNFAKFRERLKRAAELKGEIAKAAAKLAKLIRRFSDTGVYGPDEFFSIPELLRQTDNHDMRGHNLHMWRGMRLHVLGDLPERVRDTKPLQSDLELPTGPIEVVFSPAGESAEIDPAEQARNSLRYAWGTAPDLAAVLDTVSRAAESYDPSEGGMIGAAIQSRQHSVKTEYLRAIGNLLSEVHHIGLSNPILKAIAVTASVVINDPEIDVTYDDVRKVLGG